ncbi:MAG: 16S rRNA (cytidine(1402)-2'-O)-methyltransferase [Patescibacteria group bacterium]
MLYIIGTPIGNLDDLSIRQAKAIASAETLLTEDTRSTGRLLQKITELFSLQINPGQRLISYYKENEFQKLPEIMEMLEDSKEIALISEAGMPLISDPGLLIVKTVIKKNIPFIVIPGPTATITALAYSGFNPGEHMFLGFLPKKSSEILKLFEKLKQIKAILPDTVFVFYESPLRINDTLKLIDQSMPEAKISVSRELTKKFEETLRGTAKELMDQKFKGEITVAFT